MKSEFGMYLRENREQAGLSIGQLAKKAGVSPSYISQMETGQRSVPSLEVIRKLADALGVDHFLLGVKAGHFPDDQWIEWGLNAIGDPQGTGFIQGDHKQFISELLAALQINVSDLSIRSIYNAIIGSDNETRFEALSKIYSRTINRFGNNPVVKSTLKGGERRLKFEDLLNQITPIEFNGRVLTVEDRKRILDMMALLFPDSHEGGTDPNGKHPKARQRFMASGRRSRL